jgi:hypothetical protein
VKQAEKLGVTMAKAQRDCAQGGDKPCSLASCPRCRKRLSKTASQAVVERYGEKGKLQWVTITPATGRIELGEAAGFDVKRSHEQVRRKLRESLPRGTEVIGALDVSVNLHENSDKHLQFHYHAFVWPPLDRAARENCSHGFNRDRKTISKPVVFQTIEANPLKGRTIYTFKWFHQRRSSFDTKTHDDGIVVRPKAKKQSLQAKERVAVYEALREYAVTDLLLSMGVKRMRSADPFSVRLMQSTARDE